MNKTLFCLVVSAITLLLLAASSRAFAGIVYSQPSDFDPSNIHVGSYFSSLIDRNHSGYTAVAYDNFALNSSYAVNRVQWQGGYVNPNTPGSISAFTITFWSDLGNQPGTALLSETIPGNAGEQYVGSVRNVPTYNYDTALATTGTALSRTWT